MMKFAGFALILSFIGIVHCRSLGNTQSMQDQASDKLSIIKRMVSYITPQDEYIRKNDLIQLANFNEDSKTVLRGINVISQQANAEVELYISENGLVAGETAYDIATEMKAGISIYIQDAEDDITELSLSVVQELKKAFQQYKTDSAQKQYDKFDNDITDADDDDDQLEKIMDDMDTYIESFDDINSQHYYAYQEQISRIKLENDQKMVERISELKDNLIYLVASLDPVEED